MAKTIQEELINSPEEILDNLDQNFEHQERKEIKQLARRHNCRVSLVAELYKEYDQPEINKKIREEKTLPEPKKKFYIKTDNGRKFKPELLSDYILNNLDIKSIRESDNLFFYENNRYLHDSDSNRLDEIIGNLTYGISLSETKANKVKKKILNNTKVDRDKMDQKDHLNLENGILEVNETSYYLKPHSPKYFDTEKLPVKFKPEKNCNKFLNFLEEVLPNEEDRKTLQEMTGEVLLGRGDKYDKMFLLYGSGSNGKSSLMNIIKNLIGSENTTGIPIESLSQERFKAAKLVDSKLNVDGDLSVDKVDSKMLKKLTGGDTITVEEKYDRPFEYKNDTVLTFLTNHIPETEDHSNGFFRRWIIIEFNQEFTDQNDNNPNRVPNIEEKICTPSELSGILNWAIKGYLRLERQGHFSKNWSTEYTRSYWYKETDPTKFFIEKKVTKSPQNFQSKDNAYTHYENFCDKHGLISDSKNEFCKKIKQNTNAKKTRKTIQNARVRGWKGILIS